MAKADSGHSMLKSAVAMSIVAIAHLNVLWPFS